MNYNTWLLQNLVCFESMKHFRMLCRCTTMETRQIEIQLRNTCWDNDCLLLGKCWDNIELEKNNESTIQGTHVFPSKVVSSIKLMSLRSIALSMQSIPCNRFHLALLYINAQQGFHMTINMHAHALICTNMHEYAQVQTTMHEPQRCEKGCHSIQNYLGIRWVEKIERPTSPEVCK